MPQLERLLLALLADPDVPPDPREQALWMLLANFLSAAIPILPFVFLPIPHARPVSATVTITLLVALGAGRVRIAGGSTIRTIAKTVSIGITAAFAGVVIGLTVDSGIHGLSWDRDVERCPAGYLRLVFRGPLRADRQTTFSSGRTWSSGANSLKISM